LNHKAGVFEPLLRLPIRHLLERLLIVFGFLHSDDSSRLTIRLQRGTPNELVVRGYPQPSARRITNKITRKLRTNRHLLRGFAMRPNLGIPGEGNHSGGTFPMREHAAEIATDIFGRVATFERVHIVDASVMPSIAAASITLTAMANAHRIATECDL
jgi:choline dehydrogenase-like flavoprotein